MNTYLHFFFTEFYAWSAKVSTRNAFVHFRILGCVALLSHNTSKRSAILGLSFLHGASGPGNPCYGVQARISHFTFKSANTLALCYSKAMLPKLAYGTLK